MGRRSAYGLEAAPVDNWARYALCAGRADLWGALSWVKRSTAVHICLQHCPVLEQCRRDLERTPVDLRRGMVTAGVAHNSLGGPMQWRPQSIRCSFCRSEVIGREPLEAS
jgi:hypothetical protein